MPIPARSGVALGRGRRDEETTCPELLESSRLCLIMFGVEIGGRLSLEAFKLLLDLAEHRARQEPQAFYASVARSLRARWATMLSIV